MCILAGTYYGLRRGEDVHTGMPHAIGFETGMVACR